MFWNLQSNLQPFGAQTMLNQLSHIGQGLGAVFENIRVGVSSSHIMWGFEYMECCTQMSHASLWLTPLYFWYLKPSRYIFFLNCISNMDHQALKWTWKPLMYYQSNDRGWPKPQEKAKETTKLRDRHCSPNLFSAWFLLHIESVVLLPGNKSTYFIKDLWVK